MFLKAMYLVMNFIIYYKLFIFNISYSEDREEPSSQSDETKPKILLMGLRR